MHLASIIESQAEQKGIALRSETRRAALILGFMGSTAQQLQKKYQKVADDFAIDMAALNLPLIFVFSDAFLERRFDEAMKWLHAKGLLERVDTLVVCSSGGALLHYHLKKWHIRNPEVPLSINRILWENGPGDCTIDEVYRGIAQMFGDKRDHPLLRTFIKPLLNLVNVWCGKLYSDVRDHTLEPHFLQKRIIHQFCIACRNDNVVLYDHLKGWAEKMKSFGLKMQLETFDDLGHLKAHRNPARYQAIWSDLLCE